jgi:aerobic-type carbon monoxide dehydrogenase small subunit (CoxS/CutS family)
MAEVVGEKRSAEEITDLLGGHLCRCTGYVGIKAALEELATPMQGQALEE